MVDHPDCLLTHATVATLDAPDYGLLHKACVAVRDGRIAWVGALADVPPDWSAVQRHDMGGRLVTPGLIDCHTHLVFGGNRAAEFERRLNGATYQELARAGGGILSTVRATRSATVEDLVSSAQPRLESLMRDGVTTVEIKSGYGLDPESELNMLRAARRLAQNNRVRVRTTYLGAHAVPPEFSGDADGYIDRVCIPTLRAAHAEGLVDAVDGFCEAIAFDTGQIARVFEAAHALGLPVKLHAEQLSHQGGCQLAARFGALSADHLEYATPRDAAAMARAGVTAVILPGAFYTLRETRKPPISAFREHGVPMALATDCNPGSSPLGSVLLAMNMGCTLFEMTPQEALAGVTRNAALALGLTDCGRIAPGYRADLAIWDVETPAELSYRIGFSPSVRRVFGGAL